MKKHVTLFFFLFPLFLQSQTKKDYFDKFIEVNYSHIDTTDDELKAMVNVWTSYLKSRFYAAALKNDTVGCRFWNNGEKQLYRNPNFVFSVFPGLFYFHTTVLNIEPFEDHYFRILNCNTVADSTGKVQTKAIYYVLVKKIKDAYKLFNYFYHEKEKLKTTSVGMVQYYYPQYYQFSSEKANRFIEFQDSLSVMFNQPVRNKIIYIVDTNTASLMARLGFVYQPMLPDSKNGRYMADNSMLLSSCDENHRHELVHYFTSLKYPDHILIFDEGLATCLGGCKGHDLKWHANNLYQYFIHDMNSDTSKILSLEAKINQTDPVYIKGAIIMKYTIDKYGFQKALNLLSYSEKQYTDEEVIEKELGISRLRLNSFLLEYMKKYAGL